MRLRLLIVTIISSLAITLSLFSPLNYNVYAAKKPNIVAQVDRFPLPIPLTDESVYEFLEVAVRIKKNETRESGWMGSGTLVYQNTDHVYVLSCAHIFDGDSQKECGVEIFYKDDKKLEKSLIFKAEVLGINHYNDISIMRFKTEEKFKCFRIAPVNYKLDKDLEVMSAGFDQAANKLATYKTIIWGKHELNMGSHTCPKCGGNHDHNSTMTATYKTGSCRHGRSGGGLLSYDKKTIGICSRGSEIKTGTGYGYYVSLQDIHDYVIKLNLKFLLTDNTPEFKKAKVFTDNGVFKAEDFIPLP